MKKRKIGRTLSRTSDQRLALKRTMLTSLILHKRIETTLAKAKELKPFAERMVTRAKKTTVESKNPTVLRLLGKDLSKKAVHELISIAEKFSDRNGGYTRIIKLGARKSDSAKVAIIELVDFEQEKKAEAPSKKDEVKDKAKKEDKVEKEDDKKAEESGKKDEVKIDKKDKEEKVSDKKDKKQE